MSFCQKLFGLDSSEFQSPFLSFNTALLVGNKDLGLKSTAVKLGHNDNELQKGHF